MSGQSLVSLTAAPRSIYQLEDTMRNSVRRQSRFFNIVNNGTGILLSRAHLLVLWVMMGFGTVACERSHTIVNVQRPQNELWGAAPSARRRIDSTVWDTVYTFGGSARDSLLRSPSRIAVTSAATYVYDAGFSRVVALDTSGSVKWQVGRKGKGPQEFANVRDLRVTPTGQISVLDPDNARITWISAAGNVVKALPLTGVGHIEQHVPLTGGRTILLSTDAANPFFVIDSLGRVLQQIGFPWGAYARLSTIARQGQLASDSKNGDWAFTFTLGDGWFAYDTTSRRPFIGRYIVHGDFPTAIARATTSGSQRTVSIKVARPWIAAPSTALADSVLYVLYGGSLPSGATVDRYNWKNGDYLGSIVLPVSAKAIAVRGNLFYVIVNGTAPHVLVLRPRR